MTKPQRIRADELLVRQGLAESRSRAKVLIIAGDVLTPDGRVSKPAEQLSPDTVLSLKDKPRFASRGGLKLDAALDRFAIDVSGLTAADIGASTGGFTDCLLQRGARRVYAVDVGYGQLHYELRQDDRVVVMERVNARYMEPLPEPVELITIDVSFISLKLILESVARSLTPDGLIVALVKPQFEAGRDAVSRQGVVRDEKTRERVVRDVIQFAASLNLGFEHLVRSPVTGPAGNEEFLIALRKGQGIDQDCLDRAVTKVFS